MSEKDITVTNTSLSERYDEIDQRDKTVLRGEINPDDLHKLRTDWYQRGEATSRGKIVKGLKKGSHVPDIELAMRGTRVSGKGSQYVLRDPVYILDGLQRVEAVIKHRELHPEAKNIRVGFFLWMDTKPEWEKPRFDLLQDRSKVSPNVNLRNLKDKSRAVATLYGLCNTDREFPLYKKVSWEQNMKRGELITAMSLAKTAARLHARHSGTGGTTTAKLVPSLDKIVDKTGLYQFRHNVKTFYTLLDECFGITTIEYRQRASWIKEQFMGTVARMLSMHQDYWRKGGCELYIPRDRARRLTSFPVHDGTVVNLAGSSGKAGMQLLAILIEHMDKGRHKHKRMRPYDNLAEQEIEDTLHDELDLVA